MTNLKTKSDLKILIAEDDYIINMFIENILINSGYSVVAIVIDGKDAITKTQEYKPDLVMMDIGLKGKMNGVEAALMIRQSTDAEIIFMTGNSDVLSTDQRIEKIKPLATFVKPIDDIKIIKKLEYLFPNLR